MVVTGLALLVLVTWAGYGLACVGTGYLVLGGVTRSQKEVDSYQAFWVGLAAFAGLCEAYCLFRRMDAVPVAVLVLAGAGGLWKHRRSGIKGIHQALERSPWTNLGMAALLVALAWRSTGICTHYDTGLYGASAVQWLVKYPTVPGLANLHGRLGFNSSLFPSVAALYSAGLATFAYRVMEGLVIAALLTQVSGATERIARQEPDRISDWFASLLLIPAVFWVARGNLVGTDTDLPATVCCLVGALFLVRELEEKRSDAPEARTGFFAASMVLLLAVTFKLSTLVFVGVSLVTYLLVFCARNQKGTARTRALAATGVAAVLLLGPWLARGYLLSGYPLYPEAAVRLPADWQVNPASVKLVEAGVKSWGRIYHAALWQTEGTAWVKPWFAGVRRQRVEFEVPVGILLAGLGVVLVQNRRGRAKNAMPELVLLAPAMAGMLFWFFTAPDPRFGAAWIWVAGACAGGAALHVALENSGIRVKRIALAGIACLAIWCLYPRTLWSRSFAPLLHVQSTNPFPSANTETRLTQSGLQVRIPVHGDQCWNAPLPCTPYFNDKLELRRPPSLADGFRSTTLPDGAEWILEKPAGQEKANHY